MTGKRVGDICPHCPKTPIMRRRDYFGGFYAWCVMCNRRWVLREDPADCDASALTPNALNRQGNVSRSPSESTPSRRL